MTPFLGFPLGEGEADVGGAGIKAGASGARASGASAGGAGVSGAGAGEAGASGADAGGAGASVADGVASGLILSANSRMAKRRHLTSLQAESLSLLGTSSSIWWIRSQALSLVMVCDVVGVAGVVCALGGYFCRSAEVVMA